MLRHLGMILETYCFSPSIKFPSFNFAITQFSCIRYIVFATDGSQMSSLKNMTPCTYKTKSFHKIYIKKKKKFRELLMNLAACHFYSHFFPQFSHSNAIIFYIYIQKKKSVVAHTTFSYPALE